MRRAAAKCKRMLPGAVMGVALVFAPAALASTGGHAEVRVVAKVLSYVKVTGRVEPASLDLSAEDVARGYVDIDQGSSLGVVTNASGGYLVTASAAPALIARVAMRIDGSGGGDRLHVASAPFANSLLRIAYRLYLQPGVAAGRHPWPVALGLSRD